MRRPCPSRLLGARLMASIAGAGLMLATGSAAGAGPQDAESWSRQLFKRAETLAAESSYQEACPYFQAAHDLNATGGTALRSADCYEKIGAYDRALQMYRYVVEHAATERVPERVPLARVRVELLEKQLHVDTRPAPAMSAPPPAPPPPPPAPPSRVPAAIAYSIGGAGLVVGGIAGALALSQASAVKAAAAVECPTGTCDNRALTAARHDATTTAWIANVGLGVAVVGAVVGTVLLVTAKPTRPNAGARTVRALAASGFTWRF